MTPQRKKQLSYRRDCRNGYGENSKSSRKNIPLRRARKHRRYRHAVKQAIVGSTDHDLLQSAVAEVRREDRQKVSDIPLAEHIRVQMRRRICTGQQLS